MLANSSNMHVEDEEQMCKILNEYFSSVFTLERLHGFTLLENRLQQNNVLSYLNNVIITEEIVYKKLCSLKSYKARGDNGMGSLVLDPINQSNPFILLQPLSFDICNDDNITVCIFVIIISNKK